LCRSQPPDLEAALLAIRDAKEGASSSSSSTSQPTSAAAAAASAAADGALKHLLLYVDADQLYRVALGLYDLSLAFMVISQAQKDPGEYLAELSAFNEPDENLRRAHIDRHLGRYPRALQHLVAAGPDHWEAALLLAQQQGLLRQLLHLLQGRASSQEQQQEGQLSGGVSVQEWIRRTLAAYGQALLQQRRAEDAAVAFTAAGDLEAALGAYK
jgi:elongator complex protein 1